MSYWNQIVLFGPESALLNQIVMLSFDKKNSGNELKRYGLIPFRYRNVCGTFVERLLLYCFDPVSDLKKKHRYTMFKSHGDEKWSGSWLEENLPRRFYSSDLTALGLLQQDIMHVAFCELGMMQSVNYVNKGCSFKTPITF
jgi:hypothetical protein